jgi:hypothetical protein
VKNHLKEKNQIANEILAYLADHPNVQDTFEGIVEWWLLERTIKQQMKLVKEALKELVEQRFVIQKMTADSRILYSLNRRKRITKRSNER